ncbi:MAG: 1-(5-phosphoribosyl)-5-[(5-phosphoribosylamino)methylideneamino]imidazole-4-carboxamide isomerase [Ruminococcaceae bacterium]|nr:1-(5-phosphoribosyl)-5-[(5-phosphoribosylamino)methylideneamino]imidazole-4-carboxamide isomerase [Oscillospiraceae bacterium]
MLIFPAIDLYEGKAVRLLRGEYDKMTVYSENPPEIAAEFKAAGASCIHLVDLEGAKEGTTPNLETVRKIVESSSLFAEIGGGIRSMETIEKYVSIGVSRVILGTAAVEDEAFLARAVEKYGEKIAVGADIKDGFIAVRGWTEKSDRDAFSFCRHMEALGVKTLICTDISKDGAMQGTNRELYRDLSREFSMQIVASGGVSSIDDVRHLAGLDLYGAIIGKAYYTGAISLREAIEVAK